ncbi:MAG: ABC transporter ATP-binding protein, partial [Rhodopirellula bahusiensis]
MSSTVVEPTESFPAADEVPVKFGTIVSVNGLQKIYRGSWLRSSHVHALSGVTLNADAGQVFGLLGPNGAGKTTLIKILLGVIRSSGGSASLFGLPAGSAAARRRVGYLPESLRVDRHHTARSALKYYGRLSGLDGTTIGSRSDELLQLVGLAGRDREPVRRFSKGMLQRLGLAQALMHDPDLLVLDEPTDGLDPVGRSEVRRVIERLRDAGKTIFLNSHILHEVELVCTHLAIMAKGRVLASGPINNLSGPGLEVATSELTIHMEIELERSNLDRLQN